MNDSKLLLLLLLLSLLLSWKRARAYAGIIVPSLVFAGFIRAVVQPHMGSNPLRIACFFRNCDLWTPSS